MVPSRRAAQTLIGVLIAVGAAASPAAAHGFGQRYDLPVPLTPWIAGAAGAVAVSFAVIGFFMRGGSGAHDYPRLNLLRWPLGRFVADRRALLGARVLAGLTPHDTRNENQRPARLFEIFLKRCD